MENGGRKHHKLPKHGGLSSMFSMLTWSFKSENVGFNQPRSEIHGTVWLTKKK